MLHTVRNFLLIVCFLVSSSVFADPIADIYQVEVIVFEHTNPDRFKAEHWPKFVGKLDSKKAYNLDTLKDNAPESLDTLEVLDALDDAGEKPISTVIKESINIVGPKSYLLSHEERMIKSSKTERFIKHIAWNQPVANNVKSTPIYFSAGENEEFTTIISIKPARQNCAVYIDAIYKIQPEDRKDDPGAEEIRMVRDVKVKRKEPFYVDHPVIGMLIIVSPVVMGTNSYSPLPNQ